MASAILTVFWPDEFTIYDTRVCSELEEQGCSGFEKLANLGDSDRIWPRYQDYRAAVRAAAPAGLPLRDKDRYLWGKSFHNQLVHDIEAGFRKADE